MTGRERGRAHDGAKRGLGAGAQQAGPALCDLQTSSNSWAYLAGAALPQ